MQTNISIENAISALLSSVPSPCLERVSLSCAAGRILAEDIYARINLPPFNRSAYDGFALRWEDTKKAGPGSPAAFEIMETITAGDFSTAPLKEGCAVRIMTGAALPEGADSVINFEKVTEQDNRILLSFPLSAWQNVDQTGAEIRCGTLLLHKGERLTPSHLGVLASQGIAEVPVCKKPKAVILSTGSELLAPGSEHVSGKIYNSNLYVFRALLEAEGFEIVDGLHVKDEANEISGAIQKLSAGADLMITTGGASVGDKDFAHSALALAGADILFAHAAMKPGSCIFAAKLNEALILSLSGNPGAALTAYYRICLPAIRLMAGRSDYMLREAMMPLARTCGKTCQNPRILKGHTEISEGKICFAAHEGQLNGMQASFLYMDAFAQLPPADVPIVAGTMVRVFFP